MKISGLSLVGIITILCLIATMTTYKLLLVQDETTYETMIASLETPNITAPNQQDVKEVSNDENANMEEVAQNTVNKIENVTITEPIVYDNMTLDELAAKLERSLNSDLKGYGYTFASYSTKLGIDPYLALAIVLEETGCRWNCSYLVKECNNIGGQKGSGCGAYKSYPTLEEGIYVFLNNIYNNYYAYGLTTAETMNPKYAENPAWASNVNAYIAKIKNN